MNIVKDGHPFIFAFAIITFAVGYWGSLFLQYSCCFLFIFSVIPIDLHQQMIPLFILQQMEL